MKNFKTGAVSFAITKLEAKIALAILAIIGFSFFSCGDSTTITHTHVYGTAWSKTAEQHWRECSCGYKKDMANHQWQWIVTTPATETAEGVETETCGVCAATKGTRPMPRHVHQWGPWAQTTAPTCTEAGEDTKVCALDEEHKDTRVGAAALGHDWGAWMQTKAPATTEEGEETRTCINDAAHKETRVISKLPVTSDNLAAHLALLSANTVSNPHNITLRVSNTNEFTTIRNTLNGAPTKYVYLDLTGSTITSIPDYAFNTGVPSYTGCATLTRVTIPNGVTSIGDSAFESCSNLASITMPNGITSIGNTIFYECASLASITIPNSVTSIGNEAFYGCASLASITIPNSITSIGAGAFSLCTSLISVTFAGYIPSRGFTSGRYPVFPGDLRDKFYATNSSSGTPGTYKRASGGSTWTRL
jgi:hypothetical protein